MIQPKKSDSTTPKMLAWENNCPVTSVAGCTVFTSIPSTECAMIVAVFTNSVCSMNSSSVGLNCAPSALNSRRDQSSRFSLIVGSLRCCSYSAFSVTESSL